MSPNVAACLSPCTLYGYTGGGALRAVPALQAKLLGALMYSDKVDHVDRVPVERT